MVFCQLGWNFILPFLIGLSFWIARYFQLPFFRSDKIPITVLQSCRCGCNTPGGLAAQVELVKCHVKQSCAVQIAALGMYDRLRLIIPLAQPKPGA